MRAEEVEAGMTLDLTDDAVVEAWHDDLRGVARAKVLDVAHMRDVGTVSLHVEGHGWSGFEPGHAFVLARPEDGGLRPGEA